MKKIFFFFLNLCLLPVAKAQVKPTISIADVSTPAFVYAVNMGTFSDVKLEDFKDFKKIGFVYAIPMSDGQNQVFIGDFSEKTIADGVVKQAKTKGYKSAFTAKRSIDNKQVSYIQLAAKKIGEIIDWTSFQNAGSIAIIPNAKEVKVVSQGFENDSIAKVALGALKNAGFKGAFLKSTSSSLLHKVGVFETNSTLTLDGNIEIEAPPALPTTQPSVTINEPAAPPAVAVDNYKGRYSITQFKTALAALGVYKGKIDDSKNAQLDAFFAKAKNTDRALKKYTILAQAIKPANEKYNDLQVAINTINDNPTLSEQTLRKSSLPIAKAYRAYIAFVKDGSNVKDVNLLMNQAIQEAFKGVKENPFPNFDPKATYAYQGLGQLIQHLRYVQGVAKDEPFAPTWIFTEHPQEATAAFSQGKNFKIVPSDEFFNTFEGLKIAHSIAEDINPNWQADTKVGAENAQYRTGLYHVASAAFAKKEMHQWNVSLWEGLDEWLKKDENNKSNYNAFKAAYYKSLLQLENYFLSKKIKQQDATNLALSVLHQTLARPLERFAK